MPIIVVISLLAGLVLAGCASNTPKETRDTGDEKKPKLTFVQPQQDESLSGPDVTAEVEIKNFKIVNRLGQDPKKGEGHIHWIVDNGEAIPSTSDTFVATRLTSGEHTIVAELHQNNHSPLDPPVTADVVFAIAEAETSTGGGNP